MTSFLARQGGPAVLSLMATLMNASIDAHTLGSFIPVWKFTPKHKQYKNHDLDVVILHPCEMIFQLSDTIFQLP